MSLLPEVLSTENNKFFHNEKSMAKEITFYRQDNNASEFQKTFEDTLKYLKELPWTLLDGLSDNLKEPSELARRIFADPIVSDFLIRTSRLAVFSKELAKSFRGDLDSLAIIKQLKFFYNQPTVAVLQQLAILAARSHYTIDSGASQHWNLVLQKLSASSFGTINVRHFLKEINGPTCYEENAEYLEEAEPHAVYPTSIYRACEGYVLAKPDASMIESTMSLTLTTTIKIVNDVLDPANTELRNIYYPLGRCVAVIDDKVQHLYGSAFQAYFDKHGIELKKLVFPGNETNKDISTVENILVALKEISVARNEPVLVVGGGVITDVAGFATALYHRNTPYVMLCTSIVSGIDAGPSPRTCCDGFGYKNLYGAYHPPVLTIVDRSFFRTLHHGWIRHGIAEIVKMAVVKDEELFSLLEQASVDLVWTKFGTEMEHEFGIDHEAFGRVCDLTVGKALEGYVKSEYGNLWETHQCRPHAYGHTWSPGYELPSGMLHGHAVATGMGFGAYLSFCEGWITENELSRILKLLSDLELSLWHPIMEDKHRIWDAQKKMVEKRGGNLAAPVPKGLGKCGYINHMPYELLAKRLKEYHRICQGYPRRGLGVDAHCRDVGLEDPSIVGSGDNKLPRARIGRHDSAFDEFEGLMSYSEWIEEVQKKRTKGLPYHVAFEKAEDTPNPPPFEHNELHHPGVEDYAVKMTEVPSSDIQKIALVTEEKELFSPCMVGQLESQFLKMMAQLSNAKRVLDVGTFTGMSAMAFAEGLPDSGEVVTIEFDPKIASVADHLFRTSSQSNKLALKVTD